MEMTDIPGLDHVTLMVMRGRGKKTFDDFVTPERLQAVRNLISATMGETGEYEINLVVPREGRAALKESFWRTEETATRIAMLFTGLEEASLAQV